MTYAVKSSIFSAPCSCVSFHAAAYVMGLVACHSIEESLVVI